jgi:hypothetical protein
LLQDVINDRALVWSVSRSDQKCIGCVIMNFRCCFAGGHGSQSCSLRLLERGTQRNHGLGSLEHARGLRRVDSPMIRKY